jgi:hypothetical protein
MDIRPDFDQAPKKRLFLGVRLREVGLTLDRADAEQNITWWLGRVSPAERLAIRTSHLELGQDRGKAAICAGEVRSAHL